MEKKDVVADMPDGEMRKMLKYWLPTLMVSKIDILQALNGILRWKRFRQEGMPTIRNQTVLQHSIQLMLITAYICQRLQKEGKELDLMLLVLTAFVHDHGEGILQRDVQYNLKQNHHDVNEYKAFSESIEDLDSRVNGILKSAFLLQFATKPSDELAEFGQDAMAHFDYLRANKYEEVCAFPLIEQVDYFLYNADQLEHMTKPGESCPIMYTYAKRAVKDLPRLLEGFPEFKVFFDSDIFCWLADFALCYDGERAAPPNIEDHQ